MNKPKIYNGRAATFLWESVRLPSLNRARWIIWTSRFSLYVIGSWKWQPFSRPCKHLRRSSNGSILNFLFKIITGRCTTGWCIARFREHRVHFNGSKDWSKRDFQVAISAACVRFIWKESSQGGLCDVLRMVHFIRVNSKIIHLSYVLYNGKCIPRLIMFSKLHARLHFITHFNFEFSCRILKLYFPKTCSK